MNKIDHHVLDQDLQMKEQHPDFFDLDLSENWSISKRPNGGYLMAVIAKAMQWRSNKKATPIITANYIVAPKNGNATIQVEVISESTTFTRLMAKLFQDGKECIRALGTFSCEPEEGGIEVFEANPPKMDSFENCMQVPIIPDNKLFDHIDLRLDPSCTGWLGGNLSEQSKFKGWVGFKKYRPLDVSAILLFADTFPPPVFSRFGPSAWVPTIELSVNIRAIPSTHLLVGVFTSRFVSAGLVEEDGQLWDTNGKLVAISRQISKYRQTK